MIAELLQLSVPDLVLLLQQHALPWLVLTKRRDVIQKIADFRGDKETWLPCIDNANLGAILALLLTQDTPGADGEAFAMTLLRYISPHFDGLSLADLLRSGPVPTILELLKAAGEADEGRKPRVSLSAGVPIRFTNLVRYGPLSVPWHTSSPPTIRNRERRRLLSGISFNSTLWG